jgi:hypothetical protein
MENDVTFHLVPHPRNVYQLLVWIVSSYLGNFTEDFLFWPVVGLKFELAIRGSRVIYAMMLVNKKHKVERIGENREEETNEQQKFKSFKIRGWW